MLCPLLPLLFLSFAAFAAEPAPESPLARHEKPSGMGKYGVEVIDSIDGAGLVKLQGTSVKDVLVSGSLVSQGAKLGSLQIQGEANLRDTTVAGETTITGFLQTHSSTFEKPVSVCTGKALFTHTKIHSITVRKEPSFKGKQIIELKQGTTVAGNVHFESGKGEVHIDASSRIEGKVTGGKVIRRSS